MDMPNTSACSLLVVEKPIFHCKIDKKKIFSSRVRDGVIDYQDGFDEFTLDWSWNDNRVKLKLTNDA